MRTVVRASADIVLRTRPAVARYEYVAVYRAVHRHLIPREHQHCRYRVHRLRANRQRYQRGVHISPAHYCGVASVDKPAVAYLFAAGKCGENAGVVYGDHICRCARSWFYYEKEQKTYTINDKTG